MKVRRLTVPVDFDLVLTMGLHRHGRTDPTMKIVGREVWRATTNADGPAALRLCAEGSRRVLLQAWGSGADRALEAAPALLGVHDEPDGWEPRDPLLRSLKRRFFGLRFGRTDAVIEALVPAVLEQKVTSREAHLSFARLVRALGRPAPGPLGLWLQPSPSVIAARPYHHFHRFGVERRRSDVIRQVCFRAERVQETVGMPAAARTARLLAFRGIGPWTAAEVAVRAYGDADAVSVGDFHLPHLVAWALAGRRRGDDELMLELLEPYRGHRARVVRLLELGAAGPPRRAPRARTRAIQGI